MPIFKWPFLTLPHRLYRQVINVTTSGTATISWELSFSRRPDRERERRLAVIGYVIRYWEIGKEQYKVSGTTQPTRANPSFRGWQISGPDSFGRISFRISTKNVLNCGVVLADKASCQRVSTLPQLNFIRGRSLFGKRNQYPRSCECYDPRC